MNNTRSSPKLDPLAGRGKVTLWIDRPPIHLKYNPLIWLNPKTARGIGIAKKKMVYGQYEANRAGKFRLRKEDAHAEHNPGDR